ncbi:MAG: hypothetical protein J6Q94_10390 [Clostridia bacterium]|nr:hypothetical protein [Clostridia bacterium]
MKNEISIGKDKFYYENNGNYIRITKYNYEDGTLIFTKEKDGKSYFHIHIPEIIEGLPVLVVDKLFLNVDYMHHYRHNGYDVVKFHLPENTAFLGLKKVPTGMNSVFVPNFIKEYYPRENQLLRADKGAFHFFAKKINDTVCQIYAIINDNNIKKEWVWSRWEQVLPPVEKLVVPSQIEEYNVSEICADSTRTLSERIKEVHIEDGIEVIGENCFSHLPFIIDVYLPESIKYIGAGAFGYYIKSEFLADVPTLNVHYYNEMPTVGENAFLRHADKDEYEEYADWGYMHVGTTHYDYKVVYKKN